MESFHDRLHLSLQITFMTFMGLDFESDEPRMKAELRVMMTEL